MGTKDIIKRLEEIKIAKEEYKNAKNAALEIKSWITATPKQKTKEKQKVLTLFRK